jgi:hypothetical protein
MWFLVVVNRFEKPNRYPTVTQSVFIWKPLWFLSFKHLVKAKRQPKKPMTRLRTILLSKV